MMKSASMTITVLLALSIVLVLTGCQTAPPTSTPSQEGTVDEQPVTVIPLTEPLSKKKAEVSGLAWYGDYLIILPQYPDFFTSEGDGFLFALPKADILAFLDGTTSDPLDPIQIPFVAPGLSEQIDGFEGYEAIAFVGDKVYLTIEAEPDLPIGYLLAATISPDLGELAVDVTNLVEIQSQSESSNKAEEALLATGDTVITIYEVNGVALNTSPVAHIFDANLTALDTIPFPNIEYRITDATELDGDDRFWAINYFYTGGDDLLPETDPLAETYGQGSTHTRRDGVERLVEFQYTESGIILVDGPPIQLELLRKDERNWEGLVRLDDRGFLLMTDKFPDTILGFVAAP
ncbi:MAG: hypothetical protein GY832_00565 [Chloroflexi bacterium]|nr:hypothetical protein [Chloroflexota bacterium]